MNDLLDDITGLVGIFLLPKPYDLIDVVSNDSSENKASDEIILVCAIRHILFFPYFIIMT